MNATQHTPGPWKMIDNYPLNHASIPATVHFETPRGLMEVAELLGENQSANARLIAAAPDLLWALQCCDAAMSAIAVGHAPPASFQNILADARAAIAKATGDTK